LSIEDVLFGFLALAGFVVFLRLALRVLFWFMRPRR
jgi:hypothetical protein